MIVATAEANRIDRQHVDPIETFRAWRGISAKVLSDMIAVQPIVVFDKNDRRIIESKDVLGERTKGGNLATLDWQEFEHLVRQLFELEFKATGADVRVTQSSRDGGATYFHPDPTRSGGLSPAKRYTNTVDVSSVRDLVGTVRADGANRGILVTTSCYGADSYEFAKNKPLTLLDGNNLLALLQKHGFIYRINGDMAGARCPVTPCSAWRDQPRPRRSARGRTTFDFLNPTGSAMSRYRSAVTHGFVYTCALLLPPCLQGPSCEDGRNTQATKTLNDGVPTSPIQPCRRSRCRARSGSFVRDDGVRYARPCRVAGQ